MSVRRDPLVGHSSALALSFPAAIADSVSDAKQAAFETIDRNAQQIATVGGASRGGETQVRARYERYQVLFFAAGENQTADRFEQGDHGQYRPAMRKYYLHRKAQFK